MPKPFLQEVLRSGIHEAKALMQDEIGGEALEMILEEDFDVQPEVEDANEEPPSLRLQ